MEGGGGGKGGGAGCAGMEPPAPPTAVVDVGAPRFVVVRCPAQPLAEGCFVASAHYRGSPVWTAADEVGGARILFTAADGRWYVGGDGSEEQGWIRTRGPAADHPAAPGTCWEVRRGSGKQSGWHVDGAVRVLSVEDEGEQIVLRFPMGGALAEASGWFERVTGASWQRGAYTVTGRMGHWVVSRGAAVIGATVEPHGGGVPSTAVGGGMEWLPVGGDGGGGGAGGGGGSGAGAACGEEEESAAACLGRAGAHRAEAARLLALADAEEARAAAAQRRADAARESAEALLDARRALTKAELVRGAGTAAAPPPPPPPPPPAAAEHMTPQRPRQAEGAVVVVEGGLLVPSPARGTTLSAVVPSAGVAEFPFKQQQQPLLPVPAAPHGVRVHVPGVPLLCGTFAPSRTTPGVYEHREFKVYDNNGYWAVGTADDIAHGVGWLASVQRHGGRPPTDPGLQWRKWLGHTWGLDSSISVTEAPLL